MIKGEIMEKENKLFDRANKILVELFGENAIFRDGQFEAIEAVNINTRTIVVQKTGWGKSLVYFLSTKIFREDGKGVTIIISPLLTLMANQVDSAKVYGLNCEIMNSTNKNCHAEIFAKLKSNEVDVLFTTPETLFSAIKKELTNIKIGFLVIDEVHCISDWGHDFRLEYCKLKEIIGLLPQNVPILGTTATANDRVVSDLKDQFGSDVYISRGPLTRESLAIDVIKMPDKASRYAWILDNINKLDGSGIIYCLTKMDCGYLTEFLDKNGVSAMWYCSNNNAEEYLFEAERKFMNNEIKVLVATIKLGMGYDKGDIGFVIHYQMPSNVVAYYQQIGRAGRNIDKAYAIMLTGKEDSSITNHFINNAFPSRKEVENIKTLLEETNGMKIAEILSKVNINRKRALKAIEFLEKDGYIFKENHSYYLSPKPFYYDEEKYTALKNIRNREYSDMQSLIERTECLSKFVVNRLDDNTAVNCGKCSNCIGHHILSEKVNVEKLEISQEYIKSLKMLIEPRKQWTDRKRLTYFNYQGIALSRYGDIGYGELVKRDKYSNQKRFCDELVGKSRELLMPYIKDHNITHITSIPSLRSNIVTDFAKRLASVCKLEYVELLSKVVRDNDFQQKDMENSSFQERNAIESFEFIEGRSVPLNIILIDDVVDSKWTLTVCGHKLMEHGCKLVFPYALADSSQGGSNE